MPAICCGVSKLAMTEPPPIEVQPEHWAIVREILRRHIPSFDVWAFGSRARHTAKKHSDLDLVVVSDRPLPLSTHAAIVDAFSESDLPYRVDVVDWATTDAGFRKIIERDRVVVQEAGSRGPRTSRTTADAVTSNEGTS